MLLQTSPVLVLALLLQLHFTKGFIEEEKCVQSCEPGWEESGDHCYFWSSESKNWDEAEEFCKTKGAHLASVTSNATNDYIEAELKQRARQLWIGGSDKESEGVWKWSDGSTWEFTNWGRIGGIEQPSNHTGQNCLEYHISNWDWNDNNCLLHRNFLCSKKICSGENSSFATQFVSQNNCLNYRS